MQNMPVEIVNLTVEAISNYNDGWADRGPKKD